MFKQWLLIDGGILIKTCVCCGKEMCRMGTGYGV